MEPKYPLELAQRLIRNSDLLSFNGNNTIDCIIRNQGFVGKSAVKSAEQFMKKTFAKLGPGNFVMTFPQNNPDCDVYGLSNSPDVDWYIKFRVFPKFKGHRLEIYSFHPARFSMTTQDGTLIINQ